jgi:hypothetical protein
MAVCALVAVLVLPTVQASAAGNAALDGHIISDPFAGGVAISSADLTTLANRLQSVESSVTSGSDAKAAVAAEGWHRPSSGNLQLIVALIAISDPTLSSSSLITQAGLAARSAASTVCSGATGDLPASDEPVSPIPNSHYVVCKPSSTGVTAVAISTSRSNVFALIFSTEATVTRSQLTAIALRQYDAMSTDETSTSGGSGTWLVVGIIAGVVVLLVAAAVLLTHRRRLKSRLAETSAAPWPSGVGQGVPAPEGSPTTGSPPAGWYADPANPQGRRYWTGAQWGPPEAPAEADAASHDGGIGAVPSGGSEGPGSTGGGVQVSDAVPDPRHGEE